jgi:hypothetical protein
MALIRISSVKVLDGRHVELTLTSGQVVRRDLEPLLIGPVFDSIRTDASRFGQVRVADGTLTWPDGLDLCPDVIVWGGLPPEDPLLSSPECAALEFGIPAH